MKIVDGEHVYTREEIIDYVEIYTLATSTGMAPLGYPYWEDAPRSIRYHALIEDWDIDAYCSLYVMDNWLNTQEWNSQHPVERRDSSSMFYWDGSPWDRHMRDHTNCIDTGPERISVADIPATPQWDIFYSHEYYQDRKISSQ